ncbi:cytochrome c oxidase subunit II [Gemmatimonas sp.]|uniref:cytochrome c oxidase subunit II n=1 Tax=Gemmatimonas sp. TaxID=1962908 RepID=UPI00286DAD2C|nr:cytochrome c oxidase subunit II [Gemmatimonas sp.]
MVGTFRPRRLASVALLGALALGLAACGGEYPNSTFNPNSDYNAAIDALWDKLLFWGTLVFIGVEAALVYTIFKFRRRPDGGVPKQVHGNTALEITWTAIPAVILIFIAIPTVRTIFKTQAKAAPEALQVEVIGHQWWWEFRYPQYGITTANELYLPNGRTVNFQLKTVDVLHSFWIPQMGGKRDLISNRTNYLWFTPNKDLGSKAWNGFCAEFCGPSHANMRFRVFTVTADEFGQWAAHQKQPASFPLATADVGAATTVPAVAPVPAGAGSTPLLQVSAVTPAVAADTTAKSAPVPMWVFPKERIEKEFAFTIPKTPLTTLISFDASLLGKGDAERGRQLYSKSSCIGCHAIAGTPMNMANVGPNLTHVGSRHTIAGGLYPNDTKHLSYWIKSAPHMKPGSIMPSLGKGVTDPKTKMVVNVGGLTDAEVADIVAYLQALK